MNPCIDCRILLFKKAKEAMQKEGASFVVTGEVLGQRPMSQRLDTMRLIERESGLNGLVLRPLSAKALEPTIPEARGWIERNKLLAISGRGRRGQFTLAAEFGIKDYPCPSGGCLLTDPEFSRRLKDLMRHQEFDLGDIRLLKVGRHFRLNAQAKLVVGRNEEENGVLGSLAQDEDYLFMPDDDTAGPTALGRGIFNEELINLSGSITSRYCDLNGKAAAQIIFGRKVKPEKKTLLSSPINEASLAELRL
jgi:tRNA U34 2-thiouridine synthase MnmA/TrmU